MCCCFAMFDRNWGTVKIILAVLICTPRQVISQQGGVSLSGDACKPSSEKNSVHSAMIVQNVSKCFGRALAGDRGGS